jgi:putative phosphoesterase
MKGLIVSDSHNQLDKLIYIFEEENPEFVIFAGDNSGDAIELSYIEEKVPYHIVRGNCDYFDHDNVDIMEFSILGKKIFLTHGHLYGVKTGYEKIKFEALKRGVDVVIFGHTHIPYINEERPILFNPGAVKDDCYGILEIFGDEMKFYHKKL